MKSNYWGLTFLAVGVLVGTMVGGGFLESKVEAQGVDTGPQRFAAGAQPAASGPATERFQISAWGMASPQPGARTAGTTEGRGERGCYILDTVTGELWHAAADGQAKKISDKLR